MRGGHVVIVDPSLDSVAVKGSSDGAMYVASVPQTDKQSKLKFKAYGTATNGNTELIAAVNGTKIRVHQLTVQVNGTQNYYFTSASGGDVIYADSTHKAHSIAGGGFALKYSEPGWFETNAGEALVLNQDSTSVTSGVIGYTLVEN